MYLTVRHNAGHIDELDSLQSCSYEWFINHYTNIIEKKLLLMFAIKINGILAGMVEVHESEFEYTVGYWVSIDYRGRGFASAALYDIILHDLDSTKRIVANVTNDNKASSRVLEKVGFVESYRDGGRIYYYFVDKEKSV
jgi:RimJ/RimL family protein N-acetyltransferase